jgi:mono/diheme cytochrome c family protein
MNRALLTFALLTLSLAAFIPRTRVVAGSSAKARGAEIFANNSCAHCHGAAGIGGDIGPDLSNVGKRMNKAAIARQIHDGGQGMPPFGDQLTAMQIDDLVAYLRSKRKALVRAGE